MNKAQKIVVGFFVISIIVIAVLFAVYLQKTKDNTGFILPEGNVFYYGITCSHCKIVEEFMDNNSIDSKINITRKEVFENQTNAREFLNVGKACNLPNEEIGAVPLFYSGGKCYIGEKPVIDIMTNMTNLGGSA